MSNSVPMADPEMAPEIKSTGFSVRIIAFIGFVFAVFQIYSAWHGSFFAAQQRGIHWALISTLIFFVYPMKRETKKESISFFDTLLAVLSVATILYLLYDYETLILRNATPSNLDLLAGGMMILLVLEATRRAVGYALVIVAGVFLVYAAFGEDMPGIFAHRPYPLSRIISYQYMTIEGMLGVPLGVCATFISLFVIYAAFLEKSGGGKIIMDLAFGLTGWTSGGPAKAAVVGSGLFGTISGSAVANVVSTGTFTIPLMKKTGFEKNFAGAVEAVASTGGQIMPPMMGAAAFIMAEYLSTPYIKICMYAVFPAILYYYAVFIMVHLTAKKTGMKGLKREELPSVRKAIKDGWHLILSVVTLLSLLSLGFSPMMSALYCVILLLACATLRRSTRMSPRQIYDALGSAAKGMCTVSAACACAGIVIGAVTLTGVGFQVSEFITEASGGHLFIALFFTAVVSLIMGMGLPVTACYLLLAILGAPALEMMGAPLIGAHMFVFYYGVLSCITPPVALAAYAAAGISGGQPMKVGYLACKLGIVAFVVPFMFVYEPALLLIGKWYSVIQAVITAVMATTILGVALTGFLYRRIGIFPRIVFFISGLMLMYPGTKTDIAGFVMAAVTIMVLVIKDRKVSYRFAP
jgi:TRAP transporter 4TM/12TM fusion protein